MVDLVVLQSVSYLAAAISVILYVTNLFISNKKDERNRRIAFTTNMLSTIRSKESYLDMMDMLNFTWSDLDDFIKKYDSKADPSRAAQRASVFDNYDTLGYLLKEGLVDPETIYYNGGWISVWLWVKFGKVIRAWRKLSVPATWCQNLEYLAFEMWGILKMKDPTFITDQTQFPAGAYERAFSKPQ